MAHILMTGATGALGWFQLPALLDAGHRVFCLVRSPLGGDPLERLNPKVRSHGNVVALRGDVVLPLGGLSQGDIEFLLREGVDEILHCAASIKFDESAREETFLTNVDGLKNVLDLADLLKVRRFHHVSTSYVAGDQKIFTEEDFCKGQRPRNPYEASKLEAERLAREWAGRNGVALSVYRPSIVVGSSLDGSTHGFDGFYGFFKSVVRLRQGIPITGDRPGDRREDIWFDGQTLHLPIVFRCDEEATLNLTPVDWVAETTAKLMAVRHEGVRTYHLVHPNPPKVRWVIETSLQALNVKGATVNGKIDKKASPAVRKYQRAVTLALRRYDTYVGGEAYFGDSPAVAKALGGEFVPVPPITAALLKKFINYAEGCSWGEVPAPAGEVREDVAAE